MSGRVHSILIVRLGYSFQMYVVSTRKLPLLEDRR